MVRSEINDYVVSCGVWYCQRMFRLASIWLWCGFSGVFLAKSGSVNYAETNALPKQCPIYIYICIGIFIYICVCECGTMTNESGGFSYRKSLKIYAALKCTLQLFGYLKNTKKCPQQIFSNLGSIFKPTLEIIYIF